MRISHRFAALTLSATLFSNAASIPSVDSSTRGVDMLQSRAAHTATLLADGNVLVAGGMAQERHGLRTTELYIAAERRFQPAATMQQGRQSHTATRLRDGKILFAGGFDDGYLSSSEIYNPATNRFTPGPSMSTARSGHTETLLPDGRVLLLGGVSDGWTFLNSAEIYNPATGRFTHAGTMLKPRESHTATLLTDGKVLITGGHNGPRGSLHIEETSEIFNPTTGISEPAAAMSRIRHKHDAVKLRDGRVLIIGGADERDNRGAYRTAEIFNPRTRRFTPAGDMASTRYKLQGTSLVLADGSVLVLGGARQPERFNPTRNTFEPLPSQPVEERMFATATLLHNGEVLLAGGYGPHIDTSPRAWVLQP